MMGAGACMAWIGVRSVVPSGPKMCSGSYRAVGLGANSLVQARAPDPESAWSLVPLAPTTPVPGPDLPLPAARLRPHVMRTAPATLPREAGQVGEGLVDGLRHALAQQAPGSLVSRGGLIADTGSVGRHPGFDHIEKLPGGS